MKALGYYNWGMKLFQSHKCYCYSVDLILCYLIYLSYLLLHCVYLLLRLNSRSKKYLIHNGQQQTAVPWQEGFPLDLRYFLFIHTYDVIVSQLHVRTVVSHAPSLPQCIIPRSKSPWIWSTYSALQSLGLPLAHFSTFEMIAVIKDHWQERRGEVILVIGLGVIVRVRMSSAALKY